MLEGFERISPKGERISLTFSKTGIILSHGTTKALMPAQKINVLINNVTRYVAVQSADNDDHEAIEFKPKAYYGKEYSRINNKDILLYICNLMKWDLSKNNFIVSGRIVDDNEGRQTIIFGLEGATTTKRKERKK